MLNVLQPDEELMMVNNIDLRDFRKDNVSVLVDTIKNKSILASPPERLTQKELETTLMHLMAFEQFLLKEFSQVRVQINSVYTELKSRKEGTEITPDGIPKDVEERLSEELKKLLNGEQ
ncbi:MAG: hypothetical protein JST20_13240 [Bacteroidetes bacterium]|nr:hypothetical protein [Bacteroidota bacterium]